MLASNSSTQLESEFIRFGNPKCQQNLALQLHFSFYVRSPGFGLMSTPPERPCDDVGRLDAPLRELDGDAADFLDRPADQE